MYQNQSTPFTGFRVRKKRTHYRIFMLITLLVSLGVGFFWYGKGLQHKEPISPLAFEGMIDVAVAASTVIPSPSVVPPAKPLQSVPLKDQIAQAIGSVDGTFGIAVKNLKTGESYFDHADDSFTMASTYKVPLVLASFIDEESGDLPSSTTLGMYPLERGRELIITRSEEDLAQILAGKVGWGRVQEVATSMGMTQTKYTTDFTTSPRDMMTVLEKIYLGQGMSKSVRDKMYDLLERQEINDRLPKYLPDTAKVAHKTGELDDNRHDIGIVTSPETEYAIVLMSKDLGSPEDGKEVEAKLSLLFYNYFTKRS